jgi:hypothetical protein
LSHLFKACMVGGHFIQGNAGAHSTLSNKLPL